VAAPRRPMDAWDDPELASIFQDEPDLYELGRTLKQSRPEPGVGQHFEPYLRAKLLDQAARELRPRGLGRFRLRPGVFAGGGAALGVAMIAAVVVASVLYHPHDTRVDVAYTNVAENHDVSPDDVIRVAFTQAVDHPSVEHNLQIHPATAVQTRWEGTTLVITPLHRLAANTPYTVTIPKAAVRTAGGDVAQTDVHIAFGTKATPPPGPTQPPAQPPALQVTELGPVSGDSDVILAPDGTLVALGALVGAAPSASPSPTATPLLPLPVGVPSGSLLSPAASAAATPSASPAAANATARMARLAPSGPTLLGPAAAEAAFSPSGASLAYLVTHGTQADLDVAKADGSGSVRLVRNADATSPLAWSGEDSLVYVSGGQVSTVDLQGRARPVSGAVRILTGQDAALAPGGQFLYVGPAPAGSTATPSPSASPTALPSPSGSASPSNSVDLSTGHLVDLSSGAVLPLHGVQRLPAFSGDGTRVAWVDESGDVPLLQVSRTGDATGTTPTTVSTAAATGDTLAGLALSGDGSRVLYSLARGGSGSTDVRVVTVSSGSTVAVGDGLPVLSPALSSGGDRIAFLRPDNGTVQAAVATVPGAPATSAAADAVPADASAQVDRFVAAQLGGDTTAMQSLSNGSVSLSPLVPTVHVTRSYVIKAALAPDTGQVTAQVRLVLDATRDAPVSFADETLKLDRTPAGPYLVTAAAMSDFKAEPNGPQIVHVSSERQGSTLVVRIAFDSDLDPATVTGSSIVLTGPRGGPLSAEVTYEVESRTAVVRVSDLAAGGLTLSVSGALHDIAGQALSSAYSTSLQG
jgi:hypothetical protein